MASQKLKGFVSLRLWMPLGLLDQYDSHHLALWTQTNFDLGSLSLGLVPQILLVFVLLSLWTPTNIYIGFVSLGLLDQTDSHHSALWTQTNFDLGTLSLSLIPQILLAFDSLSLWTPTYINDSFPLVC